MNTQSLTTIIRRFAVLAVALPALAQVGNLQLSSTSVGFTAQTGTSLPLTQTVGASSSGAALPLTVSVRYLSATGGWLAASSSASTTPATITITATPGSLTPGVYNGQVLVVSSTTQSALISVTFTVTSATTGSQLSASPSTVSLSSSNGYTAQGTVTISSQSSTQFQLFTNTSNGGAWLSLATYSGTAPTTISILANPAGLATGVYSGTVSVVPISGSTGITIPVTFTVDAGGSSSGFSVSPGTLSFAFQTGGSTPAGQSVYVNNTSGIVSYTASASTSWLKLTSNNNGVPSQSVSGTSNSNLVVYVDPTGLSIGSYNGSVTVTASNSASQTISVSLTVSNTAILSASPSSLQFNYLPANGVPAAQTVTISTTGSPVNFTTSASSTGWLQAGPQSGSTSSGSNVITVSISPVGMPAGSYSGNVYVSTGNAIIAIPVSLTVGTSNFSTIAASPGTLSFQAPTNGPSSSQAVTLSASTTKSFLASASTSGGNWLQVSPSSGFTPATLTVTINPQLMATAGVYSGLIQVTNLTDSTQLTIPVTMTLNPATIAVSPQALSYNLAAGSPSVVTQTVQLTGSSSTGYTATSDSAWLTVTPPSGSVPQQLSISATAANLSQGNYTGIVTVSSGGSVTTVTVSATVGASVNTLTLSSTNLTFAYTSGGNTPPAQTISVGSTTGAPLNFSATARTTTGANWLLATAGSFSTPTAVTVSVQPAGLAPGAYRGVITFTALGSGETRSAEVLLNVAAPAAPTIRTAEHGATRLLSSIAPGMIMSLKGSGLGPFNGVRGNVSAAGAVETFYGGYRVFFDGAAAPILYLSDAQIDIIAPYSIAGRGVTRVTVDNGSASSGALELIVSPDASPGIFTMDSTGRGQAAALNQNGTLNSASNPAAANSVIVLYATGEGQTQPAGQDGRVILTDLRKPVLPVAVNIGGVPVDVLYAGSAPGQVSGLMQVNVQLNSNVPRGSAVPVEIRVGPAPSPAGVTVAIQ